MNVPVLGLALLSFACAYTSGRTSADHPGRSAAWAALVAACLVGEAVVDEMDDWRLAALISLAGAAYWAWRAWRNWRRRKRKRSLKALGNKARARLAALLRSMPKPGPVLRPVPQGALA